MRWPVPISVLLISVTAVAWIQLGPVIFKPHFTALVVLATGLLLALWHILLTGLSLKQRLLRLVILLGVIAGTGFVIKNYTRMEGSYTGGGFPRLVWIWSPKADEALPAGLAVTDVPIPGRIETLPEQFPSFPEYLGPGRANEVAGVTLARDWKTSPPREIWRRPVGAGWSGFAIAQGRAVTQEQRGANELTVCYRLQDGEPLWVQTNVVRFSEALGGDGPRATPTIAGDRVYVVGATGLLDALEFATGRRIWSRDTLKDADAENLTWGKSASPLVLGDTVVVSGGETGPLLLAYRTDNGEPVWRGGSGRSSYASPAARELAERSQILSVNGDSATGHDPQTGTVLWHYSWPGSFPKCAQPVAVSTNRVFISAAYGLGSVLLELTPEAGGKLAAREVWRSLAMKAKFASVTLRDGFIYGLDDGILACLELETGKRRWKGGRYGHGQVLLVGDLLLVQTEPGDLALVEATPEDFREIARHPALTSKTWNTPALAGDWLLVRNDREAVCFQLPLAGSSPPN